MKTLLNILLGFIAFTVFVLSYCAQLAFEINQKYIGFGLMGIIILSFIVGVFLIIKYWEWTNQLNGRVNLEEEVIVINKMN